jgi:hypothetical protein
MTPSADLDNAQKWGGALWVALYLVALYSKITVCMAKCMNLNQFYFQQENELKDLLLFLDF